MRSENAWPDGMPVAQVRLARPTNRLNEVVRFYGEGLGLEKIGSFAGHAGYDGVMFGLPGREYHLEFTCAGAGSQEPGVGEKTGSPFDGGNPTVREGASADTVRDRSRAENDGEEVSTTCDSGWARTETSFAPPTRDNLLVLYLPDQAAIERIAERLSEMGYPAVEPENPYWAERGVTIEDPDGWRVVLMNSAGI